MEIAQHIAALRTAGGLLAAAAERAGLDAKVPSCPKWLVRDLVRHTKSGDPVGQRSDEAR